MNAGMFAALGERDYRRFWTSQFISNIGTWMQTVAQGWLVLRLTDSPFLLGFVGFANSIPVFFLMLPAGVVADQIDRRRVLRAAQGVQALCALFLAISVFLQTINVWQIVGVAAIMGITTAFSSPTYQALVLDLLNDRSRLANAIAMNSLQFNLARVFGPLLAGILLTWAGTFYCFLFNAASFLPLLFILGRLERRQKVSQRRELTILGPLLQGFRFVAKDALVWALLAVVAASSLFGYPYVTLMPLFARTLFGHGASGLALLMGTLGVGALSGSLLLTIPRARSRKPSWVILLSLATFGAALVLAAASLSLAWVMAGLYMAGLSMVTCLASVNTHLQHIIPDDLRGRVLSMYTFAFFGVIPFGNLISGALAERWGVRPTFLAMGIGLIACAGVLSWTIHRQRDSLVQTPTVAASPVGDRADEFAS